MAEKILWFIDWNTLWFTIKETIHSDTWQIRYHSIETVKSPEYIQYIYIYINQESTSLSNAYYAQFSYGITALPFNTTAVSETAKYTLLTNLLARFPLSERSQDLPRPSKLSASLRLRALVDKAAVFAILQLDWSQDSARGIAIETHRFWPHFRLIFR